MVNKAHQSIIREQKSETDKYKMFGSYWEDLDLELTHTVVKPIDIKTARVIVKEYEWLGCMPSIVWNCFGIYFSGVCGGVVVFGPEYSENLGVWDKYDYTGKMILLSRGVCIHWTPKNTASRLIMESIKQLPEEYKIVTCTVDRLAGEIGTIYQACNFLYVGCMRENNPNIKGNKRKRDAWIINGKLYGSRSLREVVGSQKREDILKMFPNAKYKPQLAKDRYFLFRGTKQEQEYYKSKIEGMIKPYPKRSENG